VRERAKGRCERCGRLSNALAVHHLDEVAAGALEHRDPGCERGVELADPSRLRLMGTSITMIDRTYGHLARDSEDAIRGAVER
jgi:hypothetical protein